ncbi:hypothetical protein [Herbaspirillum huttiense]|uniref:hypothetical protein n=1 Tax=Herbaspirillum huttiense TaxID=863372 RepID=UPI0031DDA8C5
MSDKKVLKEMAALRDAAIDDLLAMTDAELKVEALQDGEDIQAEALQARLAMRDVAAAFLRGRMTIAKIRFQGEGQPRQTATIRPSLERMKQIIQQVFIREPQIGLAFREGKRQSESDWISLYDDLVSMGAIAEDKDGN